MAIGACDFDWDREDRVAAFVTGLMHEGKRMPPFVSSSCATPAVSQELNGGEEECGPRIGGISKRVNDALTSSTL